MTTKHMPKPGDWEVRDLRDHPECGPLAHQGDDELRCLIWGPEFFDCYGGDYHDVAIVNHPDFATLLAAAPDLLAAHETICRLCHIIYETDGYREFRDALGPRLHTIEDTARAAIAKAKGE